MREVFRIADRFILARRLTENSGIYDGVIGLLRRLTLFLLTSIVADSRCCFAGNGEFQE